MLANAVLLLLVMGRVWSLVPQVRSAEGLESETNTILGPGLLSLL